ncbi:FAD-dependent oxidoreductase [Aphanothece hegewaldii CCALA 016]|uniref:FAD-dependent oxidoreductase n=1 Tax=Aphanothece hegewaldii CCALA 016 TaxID=2107694 RepID=A0A2T1LS28_9CHRO|nr:FAD-dependent oxidoreductase [Aphanothece hegewaldii]PSF32128.1 FAD-dependent oxidoreductase [Aphanothece hegewaldii CCALA 016]
MTKIVIIGGGIVGATIAYELSTIKGLDLTLIEQNHPASGSTGAALGVLMGAISQKIKGRAWKLRENSLKRYETLIPELESLTGQKIPYNRQGIVMLGFTQDELDKWKTLVEIRHSQGWNLELWTTKELFQHCPQIQNERVLGAIYSPCDRQVNPTLLTQALITGASINGVKCTFGQKVLNFVYTQLNDAISRKCHDVQTEQEVIKADWVIVSGGLGSKLLTTSLGQTVDIQPVLGQAIHLKLPESMGNIAFQPVITGDDVHIVPLKSGEYWIGATVEFSDEAKADLLEWVTEQAIAFCPELKKGEIISNWSGKRPRPVGQAAPVIKPLDHYDNVLLATGHYRNGVLLAPATAEIIKEMII